MHIWTDTPVDALWQHLRVFALAANVRSLLAGEMGNPATLLEETIPAREQRAREVAACVRQADEYFAAARVVALATRPLMQYYGVLMLTKGMLLVRRPDLTLASIKYHGLTTRASLASVERRGELTAYANAPDSWKLEKEFAVTNDGVFRELVKWNEKREIQNNGVISLAETLSRLPEICDSYERATSASNCLRYHSLDDDLGPGGIVFHSGCTHEQMERVFPEFQVGHVRIKSQGHLGYKRADKMDESVFQPGTLVQGVVGGKYLVRRHDLGFGRPLSTMFATSFILADIVRYKPAFWMRCLEGGQSGYVSLVEHATELIARRFPQDVLEVFWKEPITLGGATYLQ